MISIRTLFTQVGRRRLRRLPLDKGPSLIQVSYVHHTGT